MCAQRSTHAVLSVEDEPFLRLEIVEAFLSAGFHTFEAASAHEAIEILERHPEIRAVLTDIQMPGTMDGMELAHLIRKRWPPTILVISSGRGGSPEALPAKATFLPKPYEEGALFDVVGSISRQLGDHSVGWGL